MYSKRLMLLTALAIVFAGCENKKEESTTANSDPVVDVSTVQLLHPSLPVVLPGELKAWNRTLIIARVRGYVSALNADRGSEVKKGQILAVLEAPEVVAAFNEARAQAASAESSLIEHRARKTASASTYSRIVETSRVEGAVSANELDIAYARMMSDSALANAAAQTLEAARAQLAARQQLVVYLQVRAPFDGTITERNISPGDLVGPEGSKPLFVLEEISRLRVTIAIPENLANALPAKSSVTFTVQADPSRTYEAHFARSANSVEEKNRSMMAEYDFDNAGGVLKAGMYAEVRLPITRNDPTLFVPRSAVIHSTQGVFVVRASNHTAEWVPVQKGNSLDSLVEVFGHLREGDQIVKTASEELRNGQPISLK